MIYAFALIITLADVPIIALPQHNDEACQSSMLLYMQRYTTGDNVRGYCVPLVHDYWISTDTNRVIQIQPHPRVRR